MSVPVVAEPKAHSTFRNQPSYENFQRSFEDPTDAFFLGLNEIHPHFLSEEQELLNEVQTHVLVDPRTGAPPLKYFIDFTKKSEPELFYSPYESLLTKGEHAAGLGFLLAKQAKAACSERDELIYRGSADKRRKEKLKFLEFAKQFTQTEHERLYSHGKLLKTLHRTWYQRRAEILTNCFPDLRYNTQSSLPKVSSIDWSGRVVLDEVPILTCSGEVAVWDNYSENLDQMNLKYKLRTYSAIYVDTMVDGKQEHIGSISREGISESHAEGSCCRYDLGLESLLFLLTAGDYPDMPTEMLLDIGNALFKFHDPLPARNCGWHTYTQIVQQAFDAFQTTSQCIRWVNLQAESESSSPPGDESAASGNKQQQTKLEYKPQLFSEYLANLPDSIKETKITLKSNCCRVVWHLQDSASSEIVQIHTKLSQPPALDPGGTSLRTGLSIKLEHKPMFGCEVMTKYELLKEWLTLRLLATQTQMLHRLRLSASTFELLADERITIEEIEKQLLENYDLRTSQMLGGLFEFLNLVTNIPNGHYMLRFNEKYSDKLLLCGISEDDTPHTISLHTILREKPCDLTFMLQCKFLPIADDLCSTVHRHHHVLPCAFPPDVKPASCVNVRRDYPPAPAIKNDRDFILKKLQKKKAAAKMQKKRKKARRRAREAAKKQTKLVEQQEDDELQQEIELDKAEYGFA